MKNHENLETKSGNKNKDINSKLSVCPWAFRKFFDIVDALPFSDAHGWWTYPLF